MQNDDDFELTGNKIRESNEAAETPTEATKRAAQLAPSAHGEDEKCFNKVQLSHIFFGPTTKAKYKMAESDHDFCLLFRPTSRQFSIYINKMKDEVVIPVDQIINCKLDLRDMAMKLKPNFVRAYYSHIKGNEPLLRNGDPTKGMLSGTNDIVVRSYSGKAFEFLSNESFTIREDTGKGKNNQSQGDNNLKSPKVNNFQSTPVNNDQGSRPEISVEDSTKNRTPPNPPQVSRNSTPQSSSVQTFSSSTQAFSSSTQTFSSSTHPRNSRNSVKPSASKYPTSAQSFSNSTYLQNSTRKINSFQSSALQDSCNEEIYITCTFPTERRAILYSFEGSLYHLEYCVRKKFKKDWKNSWYKSKDKDEWIPLDKEEDWKAAKSMRKKNKGYIRIEICFR